MASAEPTRNQQAPSIYRIYRLPEKGGPPPQTHVEICTIQRNFDVGRCQTKHLQCAIVMGLWSTARSFGAAHWSWKCHRDIGKRGSTSLQRASEGSPRQAENIRQRGMLVHCIHYESLFHDVSTTSTFILCHCNHRRCSDAFLCSPRLPALIRALHRTRASNHHDFLLVVASECSLSTGVGLLDKPCVWLSLPWSLDFDSSICARWSASSYEIWGTAGKAEGWSSNTD